MKIVGKKTQKTPPCIRFGLDVKKLENEKLLKLRTYRRLYNIVLLDRTQSNYEFRPNLIKQLYFLLQITPFIEQKLQHQFLTKIEEWYNSNDHKKINLSKNLQFAIENLKASKHKTKISSPIQRPKSGVEWDTTVNPFLRPYTAKLKRNQQNIRPDSSKYGVTSTAARTSQFKSQEKTNFIEENEDIEEQWERSQDFFKKYRTVHPQEEPTYQKLINLIQRANNKQFEQDKWMKSSHRTSNIIFQRPKTGMSKIKGEEERTSNNRESPKQNNSREQIIPINENENMYFGCQFSDEEIPEEDQAIDMEKKGIYTKDMRTKKYSNFRQKLLGMKILGDLPERQNQPFHKLYKMNYLQNQKKMINKKQNDEYMRNHLLYTKQKTFMKKQLARKTSSKRMFEEKKKKFRQTNPRINNFMSLEGRKSVAEEIIINAAEKQNIADNDGPYYNEKQFFQKKKKQNLKKNFKYIDNHEEISSVQAFQGTTKHERFLSEKKYDPFHKSNKDDYNKQILSDIQKIKEKLGGAHYLPTDLLMKALHIDDPTSEAVSKEFFDKKYLMMRKEVEKKKKKKPRRMHRSKKF